MSDHVPPVDPSGLPAPFKPQSAALPLASAEAASRNSRGPLRGFLSGTRLADLCGLLVVLLILVTIFGSLSEHFFSTRTAVSVANQIPDLTVVAVGMTLVLIAGGIDLSVGSLLALSAAFLGLAMADWGWSFPLAALGALLLAGACGAINGGVTVLAGLPSFIVTLGMLEMARGAAYRLTDSQTKYLGAEVEFLGAPLQALKLSPAFLSAVALVLIAQFLLTRTVFGRHLVAIGNNETAVRYSGIDSRPIRVTVFTISGLLCGVAGLMQTSRISSADPNAAIGLELSAIAAAVIGGTSLAGGRGSVINTFFGVLIITVLQTGLASVGANEPLKRMMTGGVIIAAVLIDAWRNRTQGRWFRP